MVTRAERNATDPDLGVLAGRLLFAVQRELFSTLAERGFDDLKPRHGAVLAYVDPDGVRATDLSRLSGQHKQNIGILIDELESLGYVERRPDPHDRRAKLVCPTERGLAQMRTADAIMAEIQHRHAERLGDEEYARFKHRLIDITEHQRARNAFRDDAF
ncbi:MULTISPECIES: MarR family winged helix-turn-helix transcriptional regulator [unclassified Amycolatopsis]|uniref:MarR family winged helix-turn-helix transcriptional regulator n=1 Tax=unclassified Amycolatopsis TaxID=2618356 RepID=UPI002875F565|nr:MULTISPECIES: MarR family winged helix-turn-helix transcriptional regulator [unclassified Amycolatopsis]MDS0136054.1 winged helix-turn-helix transcriptional regulator [Amycolatopsis sp. 505]MDS0145357.1 winged helix-turn-helix transcriptional regulator [Amycolatopsis sp. CM201R]